MQKMNNLIKESFFVVFLRRIKLKSIIIKKFQLYWVFALLLISSVSIAQTTIEGKISDQTGPLPGVNILEKGTSNGTTSDFDGNFSVKFIVSGKIDLAHSPFADLFDYFVMP